MLLHAQPGTERLIPWARQMLRRLHALRADLKLPAMTKSFVPESGTLVLIKATEGGHADMIYITGGVAAGRLRLVEVDETEVPARHYYVRDEELKEYAEATADTGTDALAREGRALAYTDGTTGYVARRARLPLEVADVQTPVVSGVGLAANALSLQIEALKHSVAGDPEHLRPYLWNRAAWCSESGELAAFVKSPQCPAVYRLAAAQKAEEPQPREEWSETSEYEEVTSGIPSFVTDFYDSLAIEHAVKLPDAVAAADAESWDVLCRFQGQFTGPAFANISQSNIATPVGISSANMRLKLAVRTYFDRFHDQVAAIALMPYCHLVRPRLHNTNIYEVDFFCGVRIALARLVDGEWEEVASEDFPDAVYHNINEGTGGTVASGETQDGLPVYFAQGVALEAFAELDQADVAPAAGADMPLCLTRLRRDVAITVTRSDVEGQLIPSSASRGLAGAAPYLVVDGERAIDGPDGVSAATAQQLLSLQGAARDAWLLHHDDVTTPVWHWHFGDEQTQIPGELTDVMYLSRHGDKLWREDPTNLTLTYYEAGAELLSLSSAVPAADEAAFELYGEPHERGFHFIDSLVGWSYTRDVMRAEVSTRVVDTGATSGGGGGTRTVQGGEIIVDGLGSFPIPTDPGTPQDGFSLDGTLYVSADGAGGFTEQTEAEFEASIGGTNVTFVPDGNQYEITSGGGGEPTPVYEWQTATVLLQYDADEDEVRVIKTLSTAEAEVASRGPLEETLPGVETVPVSDATLLQDEFLPAA